MLLHSYTISELAWIAVSVLILGVSKGGLPVGSIALPVLILVWPNQAEPARAAVAFMLPLLCAMDVVALTFYRRHILWKRILPLFPGALAGVIVSSFLFVSRHSFVGVSDQCLKFCVGMIGVLFVFYQATRKWILKGMDKSTAPGLAKGTVCGFGAGLTSTLAHAAGPVLQMYLLPQKLSKLHFAGTTAAFFFVLNLVKLVPFTVLGRIETGNLILAAYMLPLLPVGVATGFLLVRLMKPQHYIGFIYSILFLTSILLIIKAIMG